MWNKKKYRRYRNFSYRNLQTYFLCAFTHDDDSFQNMWENQPIWKARSQFLPWFIEHMTLDSGSPYNLCHMGIYVSFIANDKQVNLPLSLWSNDDALFAGVSGNREIHWYDCCYVCRHNKCFFVSIFFYFLVFFKFIFEKENILIQFKISNKVFEECRIFLEIWFGF